MQASGPRPSPMSASRTRGRRRRESFAFPLHAAAGPLLWVDLGIARNSADAAPEIDTLLVIHEAKSLMDNLPAIYSGDGDSRRHDAAPCLACWRRPPRAWTIESRGWRRGSIPDRTGARWLPDLAAMLGLPVPRRADRSGCSGGWSRRRPAYSGAARHPARAAGDARSPVPQPSDPGGRPDRATDPDLARARTASAAARFRRCSPARRRGCRGSTRGWC